MRDCEIERNEEVNITRDTDVTIGHCARQHGRKQRNEDHRKVVKQAHFSAHRFQWRQLQFYTNAPSMEVQQSEDRKYGRVAKAPNGEKRPRLGRGALGAIEHGREEKFERVNVKQDEEQQHAIEEHHPRVL